MSIKRIGIMTGGGDCPGLNAVIRAVVLKAHAKGWEVMGIEDATEGLMDLSYKAPNGNRLLTPAMVDDILTRGGTILGTSNARRSRSGRRVAEGPRAARSSTGSTRSSAWEAMARCASPNAWASWA